ncbi:MAG: hypothetical protein ACR2N0_04405, partial [Rubrobacteraceae bacterium]
YRIGWLDGRFKNIQNMAHNRRLAKLEDALDRLDYYRGHHAGRKACLQERPITSERAVHNVTAVSKNLDPHEIVGA